MINKTGQVVGASGPCAPISPAIGAHALLWQRDPTGQYSATDLGNLGGTTSNVAYAINDHGTVVGLSAIAGNATSHAFLWQGGSMTDLGVLPGDVFSVAFSINKMGQVVGMSCDAKFNCRGFLWQGGTMFDLNALSPPGFAQFLYAAQDINDSGDIVGLAFDPTSGNAPAFFASVASHAIRSDTPIVTLPSGIQARLAARRGSSLISP